MKLCLQINLMKKDIVSEDLHLLQRIQNLAHSKGDSEMILLVKDFIQLETLCINALEEAKHEVWNEMQDPSHVYCVNLVRQVTLRGMSKETNQHAIQESIVGQNPLQDSNLQTSEEARNAPGKRKEEDRMKTPMEVGLATLSYLETSIKKRMKNLDESNLPLVVKSREKSAKEKVADVMLEKWTKEGFNSNIKSHFSLAQALLARVCQHALANNDRHHILNKTSRLEHIEKDLKKSIRRNAKETTSFLWGHFITGQGMNTFPVEIDILVSKRVIVSTLISC